MLWRKARSRRVPPPPRPPLGAPVPPWLETRVLLIKLPHHLFKLDIWCVMTPGWDQRKPSAVLCREQTCRTCPGWRQVQGSTPPQGRVGWGGGGSPGVDGGAFRSRAKTADPLLPPCPFSAAPGHKVIPEREGTQQRGGPGSFPSPALALMGQGSLVCTCPGLPAGGVRHCGQY